MVVGGRVPGSQRRRSLTRLSLERKLPLVMSGLLLLAMTALSTMAYQAVRQSAGQAAADGLERSVTQVVELLRAPALKLVSVAETMAENPALVALASSCEEKALASGCDGYVAKPIDTRRLPDVIASFLRSGSRR